MTQQFNLQVYTSNCVCIHQKTYLRIFIVILFIPQRGTNPNVSKVEQIKTCGIFMTCMTVLR